MFPAALAEPKAVSSVSDFPSSEIDAMRAVTFDPPIVTVTCWPTATPSSANEPRSAPAPLVIVAPDATRLPVKSCVARVPPIWASVKPLVHGTGPGVVQTSAWPSVITETSTLAVGALVRRTVYESPVPAVPQVEPHCTSVRPADSSRNTPGVSSSIERTSTRVRTGRSG